MSKLSKYATNLKIEFIVEFGVGSGSGDESCYMRSSHPLSHIIMICELRLSSFHQSGPMTTMTDDRRLMCNTTKLDIHHLSPLNFLLDIFM